VAILRGSHNWLGWGPLDPLRYQAICHEHEIEVGKAFRRYGICKGTLRGPMCRRKDAKELVSMIPFGE
jgi:hypothetical protein